MSYKTDRVAGEIIREVSGIIRDKVHNPKIPFMTTVTAAEVSKDLKYARIYVSVIGDEAGAIEALNSSAGFIRHELAARLRNMRTIPALTFRIDSSGEYGRKIDSILKEISENELHS